MAAAPSVLLIYYFYYQTKKNEPKGLIFKISALGIIYTLPIYLLEGVVGQLNAYFDVSLMLYYFFEAFIVAGLCEEYIKFRIVMKYVYHTKYFTSMTDGIVYTVVASLGFACMENILYVVSGTWVTALARGFTAVPMHAVSSGIMGYFLGQAKITQDEKKKRHLINQGLWQAILIHGLYDFCILVSPILGSIFSLLTVPLIFSVYLQLRKEMIDFQNGKAS